MSLWGAVMGQSNFIMHGAGWLEGGLCASFEKFVLDAEMLQMMSEVLLPLEVSEDTIGLAAIREEIGRASCRERVCQYVSISVVPVALKKKQIKTKHNAC